MLELVGVTSKDPATALKDGSAMDHWRRMISAQGGDPDAKLPTAKETQQVFAETDGLLTKMDAMKVGVAAWLLGAGRSRQGEKVQAAAGIEMHAKPGEMVKKGAPLFTLHSDEPERFTRSLAALDGAVSISTSNEKVERLPLIVARIE